MQWAYKQGIEMRVLSDCNSVFIAHMLTGANINTRVKEVITNLSSFVRSQPAMDAESSTAVSQCEADSAASDADSSEAQDRAESASERDVAGADGRWEVTKGRLTGGKGAASHRMVIQPRHDWTVSSHGCPICPANLCKVGLLWLLLFPAVKHTLQTDREQNLFLLVTDTLQRDKQVDRQTSADGQRMADSTRRLMYHACKGSVQYDSATHENGSTSNTCNSIQLALIGGKVSVTTKDHQISTAYSATGCFSDPAETCLLHSTPPPFPSPHLFPSPPHPSPPIPKAAPGPNLLCM